jgi:hypothetical protein
LKLANFELSVLVYAPFGLCTIQLKQTNSNEGGTTAHLHPNLLKLKHMGNPFEIFVWEKLGWKCDPIIHLNRYTRRKTYLCAFECMENGRSDQINKLDMDPLYLIRASLILRIGKSKEWERDRNRKGWQVQYSPCSLCIGFEE